MKSDTWIFASVTAALAFYCGFYKGRCVEMDAQKTVDIVVDQPKIERVK